MVQTPAIYRDTWEWHRELPPSRRDRGRALCGAGGIDPRFVHISRAGSADSQSQKAPAQLVTWTRGSFNQRGSTLTYPCLSSNFTSSFTPQLYQRYGDVFPPFHSSCPVLLVTFSSSDFPAAGVLEGCKQRMAPLHYSKIPKSCRTPLDLQMPPMLTAWLTWAKFSHLRHQLCFHNITCSLLLGSIKPGPNKNLYLKLKNFP